MKIYHYSFLNNKYNWELFKTVMNNAEDKLQANVDFYSICGYTPGLSIEFLEEFKDSLFWDDIYKYQKF
jgi:hypothetical protein